MYLLFKGNTGDAFEIDAISGALRTKRKLDREEVAEYQLTAIAIDKGTPPKQTSARVKVTVEDVVDSSPVFGEKVYVANVREDVKLHTQILQVSAKSPDLNPPAVIYDMEFDANPVFSIDPTHGNIQTSMPLDYERQSEYTFKVRATSQPYFGEATVKVNVIDVNDNSPVLDDFLMLINVQEKDAHSGKHYQIPAYDPDVSDKLIYTILFGNDRKWVELNSTSGELYISPTLVNTMKSLSIGIQVSDGINYNSANGSIAFTSITQEMLNNSVALSMTDIDITNFLNSGFTRLVNSIAEVVQCEPDQVLVFDIKNGESQRRRAVNPITIKVWMVIRLKNSKGSFYGYYDAQHVQDAIYLQLTKISQDTGLKLLPLQDDICVKEVCRYQNSKDCVKYEKFEGKSYVYDSRKVVFQAVAVKWYSSFQCTCPVDYRSSSKEMCNIPINLCYSSPCGNNGKCISTEKSYACLCDSGWTGRNCEINLSKDKCPVAHSKLDGMVAINPCKNGGTCVDSQGGGFTCTCKEDQAAYTEFCQLTTRSFSERSFAAFSGNVQIIHIAIRIHPYCFSFSEGNHDECMVMISPSE